MGCFRHIAGVNAGYCRRFMTQGAVIVLTGIPELGIIFIGPHSDTCASTPNPAITEILL